MDLMMLIDNLNDNGCRMEDINRAKALYESGDGEALIKHLRKCRCDLIEEMHNSQRRVDRMDYLIRQTQKEVGI